MTIQDFVSRFGKVKATGGQFLVSCPAHEDRSPSLAVKEGADGSILLKDHGGCSTEAILAAMGLTAADLFPSKEKEPKRVIQAEYSYCDEAGALIFQAVRYTPKGFSQRRPDGSGGWIYNLQGVRRVLYRLPELLGQRAIVFVEGEKDADASWKIGIPATCNPMGAGKWDPSYATQLKAAGVVRVAVIPDNDAPGTAHAATVAAALHGAGIDVRIVMLPDLPNHGDLTDYLATHSKEDLLALIRVTPLYVTGPATNLTVSVTEPDRQFKALGERRYQLSIKSAGVTMDVDHLRRDRDGMTGELLVRVNGQFPGAKTYRDGILTVGDFNFASVQARSTRAKLLTERAGDRELDWFGLLEEFVVEVVSHERQGAPPVVLGSGDDLPEDTSACETWDVDGLPILVDDPMVLFGDSSSGKSYLALWIAGVLAERGIKVLYVDWEFSEREHRKRLRRLFQPTPKNLHYIRSDLPLIKETQRISRLISDHQYQYLICDSIGFAVDGPAEAHESARGYFGALRMCGVGSLSLAHIAKAREDGKDPTIYGSAFFRAGARSAWFVDRGTENAPGELHVGLHHRKSNSSDLLKPIAFRFTFSHQRVQIARADITKVETLAGSLPILDRMLRELSGGPMTMKDLAEALDSSVNVIRSMVSRHKSKFIKIGNKVDRKTEDGTIEF